MKRHSPSPWPAAAGPGGIAAVFLLAAVPYLLFLDWLLLGAAPDAATLMASQALKAWGLVWVAAGVMYLLEHADDAAPAGCVPPAVGIAFSAGSATLP